MLKKILIAVPVIILGIGGSLYVLANKEAKSQADRLVSKAMATGSYEAMSYESVKVDFLSSGLTMTNLRIVDLQQVEYILQEVIISDYDYLNDVPHHMNITANGISFPRGLPDIESTDNPALDKYLNTLLEDDSIPVTVNYHYDFEPENNNIITSEVGIGLENAANISFNSIIKNVPLESIIASSEVDPALAQAQLLPLLLSAEIPEISMTLQDLGIIDALIEIQAEQNGMANDEFRQQLISIVQTLHLSTPVATQQLAMEINAEVAKFLEGDKTFKIAIEPEYGGSIQQLQPVVLTAAFTGEYEVILDLLNLSVSTQ